MNTLNQASLQELLARVERMTPDTPRLWGMMTAHEMICHLNDSFLVGMGERQAADVSTPASRTLVKWIALYAPLQWPRGLVTRPEVDPRRAGTAPIEFWRDRDALVRTATRFAALPPDFEWGPHPIFHRMNEAAWRRWGYLHLDHHLRQFGL